MKISYHSNLVGKPERRIENNFTVYYNNDKKVNLGWGWDTVDLTFADVFDLITVDGIATSAALSSNNRKDEFFVSRELLMVDIDSGMTITELFEDTFYDDYAAGFYATPSHTDDAHRFRILFRLETPITDASKLSKLNRALLQIFAQADQACKDPARLFYGNITELKEMRDNLLTDTMVEILLELINQIDEAAMETASMIDHAPLDDAQKQHILELLKMTFVGSYPIWRNIGWGLKQGGFTLQDFQYVTAGLMKAKTSDDAANVWNAGSVGKVTMGSVIHVIKQHHGADCLLPQVSKKNEVVDRLTRKYKGI